MKYLIALPLLAALGSLALAKLPVASVGPASSVEAEGARQELVERGRYIVRSFGCADCHTPWHVGPNGPEPNEELAYSGHPAGLVMPPAPELTAPWGMAAAATNTAWAGPWGVSFTANLTPDPETGLGRWSERDFVQTIRSGRHLGRGRAILPPMPIGPIQNLTDDDLRAVFAYLGSLKPIANRVPDPIPAAGSP